MLWTSHELFEFNRKNCQNSSGIYTQLKSIVMGKGRKKDDQSFHSLLSVSFMKPNFVLDIDFLSFDLL